VRLIHHYIIKSAKEKATLASEKLDLGLQLADSHGTYPPSLNANFGKAKCRSKKLAYLFGCIRRENFW